MVPSSSLLLLLDKDQCNRYICKYHSDFIKMTKWYHPLHCNRTVDPAMDAYVETWAHRGLEYEKRFTKYTKIVNIKKQHPELSKHRRYTFLDSKIKLQ